LANGTGVTRPNDRQVVLSGGEFIVDEEAELLMHIARH
jgi:hypothetical protein